MAFDLSNYVDVPARLRMALEQYPNMNVLEHPVQVREVDGKTYIEVTVEVICNDDADRRATASAWEYLVMMRAPVSKSQNLTVESALPDMIKNNILKAISIILTNYYTLI